MSKRKDAWDKAQIILIANPLSPTEAPERPRTQSTDQSTRGRHQARDTTRIPDIQRTTESGTGRIGVVIADELRIIQRSRARDRERHRCRRDYESQRIRIEE